MTFLNDKALQVNMRMQGRIALFIIFNKSLVTSYSFAAMHIRISSLEFDDDGDGDDGNTFTLI
jgi:hypothetical protein